jgi:hypothetical protein
MKMSMYWEQQSLELEFSDRGFAPLDICEQLKKDGREALLEILLLNYGKETEDFIKRVERFKKSRFGNK